MEEVNVRERQNQPLLPRWPVEIVVIVVLALGLGILSYNLSERNAVDLQDVGTRLATQVQELRMRGGNDADLSRLFIGTAVNLSRESYASGLLQHISLALFVSVVLILGVDLHTRRVSRKEFEAYRAIVTQDVWQAVGKRLLGSQIAKQIDQLLRVTVAKERCVYRIRLGLAYEEVPEGRVVVRVESRYALRNLTGGRTEYPVGVSFVSCVGMAGSVRSGGQQVDLPRLLALEVDGKDVMKAASFEGEKREFHSKVEFGQAGERKEVYLSIEAIYRATDWETFISETPIENLEVFVINEQPALLEVLDLEVFHPSQASLKKQFEGSWRFEEALFPGQGFSVRWQARRGTDTPSSSGTT